MSEMELGHCLVFLGSWPEAHGRWNVAGTWGSRCASLVVALGTSCLFAATDS
jgi:hypothetical protein